jgi:hypothetical protein
MFYSREQTKGNQCEFANYLAYLFARYLAHGCSGNHGTQILSTKHQIWFDACFQSAFAKWTPDFLVKTLRNV